MENEQVKVRVHDGLALTQAVNSIKDTICVLASDWKDSYTGKRMEPIVWIIKKSETVAELNLLYELNLMSKDEYENLRMMLNMYKLAYEGSVY